MVKMTIILTITEYTKVKNDVVLSKGPNDVILKTLETTRKKQHDIILVKLNDVVSVLMSQNQTACKWARPLAHFAETYRVINNYTQPMPKILPHEPTH